MRKLSFVLLTIFLAAANAAAAAETGAKTSKPIYGTIVNRFGDKREIAIEAWSRPFFGTGITIYEVPVEPKVGSACIIETQYSIDKETSKFKALMSDTYCDGFITDDRFAISSTWWEYTFGEGANKVTKFQNLISRLFAGTKQSAEEIDNLIDQLTLGWSQGKKEGHKFDKVRYWRSGVLKYKNILVEIDAGRFGNTFSRKIIRDKK